MKKLSDNPEKNQDCNVYIIGRQEMMNELLLYFLAQKNPSLHCSLLNSFLMLGIEETGGIKNLVLCNCQDMHENNVTEACPGRMNAAAPDCYWACFNVPRDAKIAENAINDGVQGVFYETDSLATVEKGVSAILKGELWFSRDTLSATLSSLVEEKKTYTSSTAISDNIHLTRREKEILKHIARGKTNDEIAENLNISILTVKTHVGNIYSKINVPNRIQAIFWVTKNSLHLE
jgi:DNA-binding NarL/FixJ family response regulator